MTQNRGAAPVDISILLPTKNAGRRLASVLNGLTAQRIDRRVEVVIVDSGSTDGTVELASGYPARCFQIPPAEFGHGRTRNYLASLAEGAILVFLTQDAVPADEEWLQRLTEPLAEANVAACVGRQLPAPDAAPTQAFFLDRWYPEQPARRRLESGERAATANTFYSHANAACKKEIWLEHPFDERLIMAEDNKWSRTVLAAGYEIVYEPRAAVVHSHNYSLGSVFKRHFDLGVAFRTVAPERTSDWLGHGARYVAAELAYLVRRGRPWLIPYAITYEVTKFLAYTLGSHHNLLPLSIKLRMSEYPSYWLSPERSAGAAQAR